MKTPFVYGLGIAVAGFVVMLVIHIMGYLTDPEKFGTGLLLLALSGLVVIPVTGLLLGMKKVRAEKGAAGLSYGQALKAGFLIGLFAAIVGVVFNFIYFKFINPGYTETSIAWTRSLMERVHAPDAAMDQAEARARAGASIGRQMVTGLITAVLWNSLLSLILAAIVKRAPADPLRSPSPPLPSN